MPEDNDDKGQGDDKDKASPDAAATPEAFELNVNGEKFNISDREEMVRLAQMGHDYTQKTQALAKDREGFDQSVQDKAMEIYAEALQKEKTERAEGTDENQVQNNLAKRLQELESQLQGVNTAQSQKEADVEFDGMIKSVRDKYKDLTDVDEQLVTLKFTQSANKSADPTALLDAIAKEVMDQRGKYNQNVIDEFIKAKSKNPFSSGESGQGSSGAADLSKPPKTMEEAKNRAWLRLKHVDDTVRGGM